MNARLIICLMIATICMAVPVMAAAVQDFTAENVHGIAPLTVSFSAASNVSNVTSCQWGYVRVQPPASTWVSFSPDQRNTTFTFTNPGTYYIMFTEFTPDYPEGYISTTKANLVYVFPPPTPTPTPTPTVTPTPTPTPTPVPSSSIGIAVFRPANGNWYFDYNRDGNVDLSFRFGTLGDQPFIGRWN